MTEIYCQTDLSHDGHGSDDFFSEADLEPTRVRWNDDQVPKTMRQVYVDRCKAVQVRGCLLVPHADTPPRTELHLSSVRLQSPVPHFTLRTLHFPVVCASLTSVSNG